MRKSPFYIIWARMIQRCTNPNYIHYKNYMGRGITFDPKWRNFEGFMKDMYFKYLYAIKYLKITKPSLERINNNGNYCFENCTFIELKDQMKNQQKNRLFKGIDPKNKIYFDNNQREFARRHNMNDKCINKCLRGLLKTYKGWKFKYL